MNKGRWLQIHPRRDRFQLAQSFFQVGDFDARSRLRDNGVLSQMAVRGGEFLALQLDPVAPARATRLMIVSAVSATAAAVKSG